MVDRNNVDDLYEVAAIGEGNAMAKASSSFHGSRPLRCCSGRCAEHMAHKPDPPRQLHPGRCSTGARPSTVCVPCMLELLNKFKPNACSADCTIPTHVHIDGASLLRPGRGGDNSRSVLAGGINEDLTNAHHGVAEGFWKAWGTVLLSEIGDKTFFIAAILAMKAPRTQVFAGNMAATVLTTALSAALGWAAPNLVSKQAMHYITIAVFLFFGRRTLYEALAGDGDGETELEEAEEEIAKAPTGSGSLFPPVFRQAFALNFLAEWGDRSQLTTIGLAASTDVLGVVLGGLLGQAICTGVAVLGGRQVAEHINERTVSVLSGLLFIGCALHSLLGGMEAHEEL
ncbi:hypothetical protein WJX81_003181 [Elliptochloris bilobata]|uniref:GDT1 family protein n=1 Tax=Elliptochloris bilobata TaxID=381761 RepID=A0AAW1SL02_9CHLO